ncbi:phosphate acyltransferase PlsX [Iocasia frigidifontis]|uniref:Phosphate acyltransferase n=1 Tax=Iocasia fonsfrigidae TaxID=2682810 RepID=A0A8A7KJA3_9FIRM|nr:phosphate acyltransferase PlsX [Iocasia fonsfrigidae]QTL98214.1 phosphate acyltransferase PlsX [Iocasia fonsfrigidae]
MRIVIDAMGGDHAPQKIVEGAVLASRKYSDIELILTGRKEILNKILENNHSPKNITVINTSEKIDMNESPARAIKKKKDSSIVKGLDLLHKKEADAFVSAGNTGAVMAGSLFKLGRIKGIKRPSILVSFPSKKGETILMDNGANVDCKPINLYQFAIMGQIYAKYVLGIDNPKTGLLSIGEEKAKGNQLVKESYDLIINAQEISDFVGNVEGRDIYNGSCDLVICDGFVGNVVLKTTEGVASLMFSLLKDAFTTNLRAKLGALLLKPYLAKLINKTDYRQYGGAPLLGVNGVVIISHGSSDEIAIMNAVKVARETVIQNIVSKIENKVNEDGEK